MMTVVSDKDTASIHEVIQDSSFMKTVKLIIIVLSFQQITDRPNELCIQTFKCVQLLTIYITRRTQK